ncbi:MAG: Ig domain-containing protein, partial [Terriglobales bacterium]
MKRVTSAVLLSGLLSFLTLGLAGCGTSTPPPIMVTLSPSTAHSMDAVTPPQTVPITVTVANDSKAAGVTWSVSGGANPGTLINQTPTSATYQAPTSATGTFTATVTATSVSDPTRMATLTIQINPQPAITTTSLSATGGTAYNGTLSVSGGTSPYTFAITSGSLPTGLSFSTSTGAITGTPSGPFGNSLVTFKITDAANVSASGSVAFTVNPPSALTITTTTLTAGTTGTAYSQTLQATGGVPSYTWSKTAGSLPAGLSLSSAGVISGTPSGTFTGTSSFTATLTDSQTPTHTTTTAILSITVSAPPLSVTTTSLAGGTIGNAYSNQTLQATGGIAPYTWAVTTGSLPAGLTLNAATGVISGTPSGTFVGTDTFTVTVTDSETLTAKTASASLGIAISVSALSVTTSGSLATGVVNSVYPGATLAATGGITPYSWAVTTGSLPTGLTLNAATGAISGTPTASGTATFTVAVTDSETPTAKTAISSSLTIVVNPALSVTTTSLPAGVIGTAYAGATLAAAGGVSPYTWSVTTGTLPAGLTLNAATGAISGTPSGNVTGTDTFTVTATDSQSPTHKTASASLSITVTATTLKVTSTSLAGGSVNVAYSNQTLTASGGITPITWSVTTGSLPTGLTLNAATGVISGTPTGTFVGTDTFTVTATDAETPTPQMATAQLG